MKLENITLFDLFSFLAFVISIVVAYATFSFQNRAHRRQVALHMHALWNSEHMQRARHAAYAPFVQWQRPLARLVADEEIPDYIDEGLADVRHFFADLNHFLDTKAIDQDLTRKLFGGAAESWLENVFKNIHYSDPKRTRFHERELMPLLKKIRTHDSI